MHRSRLTSIVIDCEGASFDRSREFWSAALGRASVPRDNRYLGLRGRVGGEGGPYVGLQRLDDGETSIHLDIETDDVEAEVERLVDLGARNKARIRKHVVMEAPSGHAFCVVPVRRGDFPKGAIEWP